MDQQDMNIQNVEAVTASAGEPTLAEHIQAHAGAIDETVNRLEEKATALRTNIEILPASIRQLPTNQVAAIEGEIDRLKAKKDSVLAMLHELPVEVRSLEARLFAALKHLF